MAFTGDRFALSGAPGQSVEIIECGVTINSPLNEDKLNLRSEYHVHFITKGKGSYIVNGQRYDLHAGEGFMIMKDCLNSYISDKYDPWVYTYISFKGPGAELLIKNSGISEEFPIFSFDLNAEMLGNLKKIHELSRVNKARGYDVTGYFLLIMSNIIQKNISGVKQKYGSEHYMQLAVDYIEKNYSYVTVSDLAKYLYIHRTQLYRIFKNSMGVTPSEYILNYKLKKAKELVDRENVTLAKIADITGFYDVSHLSKCFEKKYGVTLSRYIKNLKKK